MCALRHHAESTIMQQCINSFMNSFIVFAHLIESVAKTSNRDDAMESQDFCQCWVVENISARSKDFLVTIERHDSQCIAEGVAVVRRKDDSTIGRDILQTEETQVAVTEAEIRRDTPLPERVRSVVNIDRIYLHSVIVI